MKAYIASVDIRIEARDGLTPEELLDDLRKLLSAIQEPQPCRSAHGASWWTNSPSAVQDAGIVADETTAPGALSANAPGAVTATQNQEGKMPQQDKDSQRGDGS